MGVKGKIVALIVAVVTALTPASRMTCAHGACHAHEDSSTVRCHAGHTHAVDGNLEAAIDRSCCRILPALPTSARDQMTVPTTEQEARTPVSEIAQYTTIREHPLEKFVPGSPPQEQIRPLSCVLLI